MNPLRLPPHLWKVAAAISVIAFAATAATIGLLYRTAVVERSRDLERAADTLSALMESVAQFDLKSRADADPQGTRGAAMSHITRGLSADIGRRSGEELVIGRRDGDLVQVLRATPGGDLEVAAELRPDHEHALPLGEALAGRRGSGRFLDYRGVPVLAAYAPVPSLEIGIVYKLDLAAMRAPFIRAGLLAMGVCVLMSGLFVAGYSRLAGRMEHRLRISEARFERAFHGHHVAMGIRRLRDDVLVEANAALLRMFGRRREAMVGWKLGEMRLYPQEEERAEILARIARREQIENLEVSFVDRAGTLLQTLMSVSYLRNGGEECALASFTDVTPLHQAKAALANSERRLRSILDSSGDRIFLLDRGGAILDHNPSAAKAYGGDLKGGNIFAFGPADVVAERKAAFDLALASGQTVRYEDRLGQRYSDVTVTPVGSETGEGASVVVISHDVSERKQAQTTLAAARAYLESILESSGDGFFALDRDWRYTHINSKGAAMVGRSKESLLGRIIWEEFPDAVGSDFHRAYHEVMASGQKQVIESEYAPLAKWFEVSIHPFPDGIAVSYMDSTERHRAAAALRESEEAFRALFEQAAVGMVSGDIGGNLTRANRRLCEMLGYSFDEIVTLGPVGITHPDDVAQDLAFFTRLVAGEVPSYRMEKRYLRKDGSVFWADLTLTGRRENGRMVEIFGVVQDIGERKHLEDQLRLDHQILESINDGVQLVRASDGVILSFNAQAERMFGYAPGELAGRHVSVLNSSGEKSPEETAAAIAGELNRSGVWRGEVLNRRKDGTTFWSDASVTSLTEQRADRGDVWVSVHRDISERKRQEEDLRLKESAIATALDGIIISDPENHMVYANPAFVGLWGFADRDEALSTPANQLWEYAPGVSEQARESLIATGWWTGEVVAVRKDGSRFPALLAASTIRDSQNRPTHLMGTLNDITERVRAERALQASLREKTTLLQEIHHRVKNNLQVVSSLLFFEQARVRDPAVAAPFQRSRERVAAISLVHEQLYQTPDLANIDFTGYVNSLGRQILQGWDRPGPVDLRVEGEGFSLEVTEAVPCALILNELLTNSLKHAFPDGRGGTVTIRLEMAGDGARHVRFGDNGVGLPGGREPESSSLGMRIIEKLTEQLQGRLVREPTARGLHFHLTIPRFDSAE